MTIVEPSAFGALLRRHRIESGLTQEELAERARISARAISDLERGVYQTPKMWTARQLAEALELQDEDRAAFEAAARGRAENAFGSRAQPAPAGTGTSNLPTAPTPFLGRHREVESVREMLLQPEVRLLTLTGPGGTGKTRLSIEAARGAQREFPDGVYFVSLAPIDAPDAVPGTIARSVGSTVGIDGLTEASLPGTIGDRRALLLLDNFEHLLPAASSVRDLLDACPNLRILVTSRVLLHLSGEHHFPVPAMSLPDASQGETPEGLRAHDATVLFLERARAVNPSFEVTQETAPAIAAICARLDGLPLAIELAAARVTVLPPQALLEQLSHGLDVLRRGARDAPERQQTMRGAIDWSYRLLGEREQALLARLSIFSGGCALDAAETVCGDGETLDDLSSLVESSLVRTERGVDGEPRFLLLETIRKYALERLQERYEEDDVRRRHAEYYLNLAERVDEDLSSARLGPPAIPSRFRLIDQEHANIVAALSWLRDRQEWVLGLRLMGALGSPWQTLTRHTDVQIWNRAFAPHDELAPPLVRARFLLAWANRELDNPEAADRGIAEKWGAVLERGVSLYRDAGDERQLLRGLLAGGFFMISHAAPPLGAHAKAEQLFTESLALGRKLGFPRAVAGSLRGLAEVARAEQDLPRAVALFEKALDVDREAGHTDRLADSLGPLAVLLVEQGQVERASALLREAIAWNRTGGHTLFLLNLPLQYAGQQILYGNHAEVMSVFRDTWRLGLDAGDDHVRALYLSAWLILVASAAPLSEARRSARLYGAARAREQELGGDAPLLEILRARRAAVRAHLGESEWNGAREESQVLTLEGAIELALQLAEAPGSSG